MTLRNGGSVERDSSVVFAPTRVDRVGYFLVAIGLACAVANQARARATSWVRVPRGCGSELELREGVRRLVGDAAGVVEPLQLSIEARGERGAYELQLALGGETRVLRDVDCQTLFRSALVMVAASARLDAAAAGGDGALPAASPEPAAAWRATAALGGGAVLGVVPELGGRVELQASLERSRFGVQLGGYYLVPSTLQPAASKPGLRVSGYGVRAGALWVPVAALRALAGVEVGYMRASSVGTARDAAGGTWALAVIVEVAGRVWRFGHGYLDLALFGQWGLVRPQFEIVGFGELHRMSRFGAGAVARLGWTIF